MTETRKVQPCGMLYSQTREYFLLKPEPIPGDSWEKDNAYRFVVAPRKEVKFKSKELGYVSVYPFARHIVSTAFVVEYAANMPEIDVQVLEEIDSTKQEWENYPEENPNDFSPFLTDVEWDRLLQEAEKARV
jgi:hypothetical protein